MSRTNLDFLFQVTQPVGERSCFNIRRIDELEPGFDDHLSQASTTTLGTTSAAGRISGRPSTSDETSNDYDSSSIEAPRSETAPVVERAANDRYEVDSNESPETDESGAGQASNPGSTSDSQAASHRPDDSPAQATTSSGTSTTVTNDEDDSEHETDEVDADINENVIAVADVTNKSAAVMAATAELRNLTASDDLTATDDSTGSVAKGGPSDGGAATKRVSADLAATDALLENATTTMADTVKVPTAPGESGDETAPSKAERKLRTAKPKSTTETEPNGQGKEQLGDQVGGPQQSGDVVTSRDAAKAETETASVDPMSNDAAQADRDAGSEESRDANAGSSTRQRSDATALANKISAATIANGAATRHESSASSGDADEGTARVGKSGAAKVDSVGDGANRLHANAGPVKRGSRTGGGDEMSRVDPARFVGRVAKAFHTAQERGGSLQIRLSPPELGAMRLELTVKDGVMTAALETETASARRVLLEHLPALRDRLAEQNIRVERFDVDVRREGTGSQADPRATQDQQQPQQGHSEQRRRQAAQPPIAETARQTKPVNPARTNSNEINLVA